MFFAILPAREYFLLFTSECLINREPYVAIVLTWALLKAPFMPYGRAKSWRRILVDRLLRLILTNTNRKQTRAIFGATRTTYDNFIRETKLTSLVEEIGDDARLLWIGPKITNNVMLYFHGMVTFDPDRTAKSLTVAI